MNIEPCFECGSEAVHEHHVVPQSQGGTKTLPLCVGCHGKVHGLKMSHPELVKAGIAHSKAERQNVAPRLVEYAKFLKGNEANIVDIARWTGLRQSTVKWVLKESAQQEGTAPSPTAP